MTIRFPYFAYGSNMNAARMAFRLPCARRVGVGYINGWTLKERLYADISRQPRQRVWGVLYALTQAELNILDRYEGYPTIYRDIEVAVHTDKGIVRAMSYMMTERTRRLRDGIPYPDYYRLLCSLGARQNGIPDGFSTTTRRTTR